MSESVCQPGFATSMESEIINVLSDLVRINSVNPTLSNGPGEEEMGNFVAQYLTKLELETEIQRVEHKRENVVAVIPGMDRKNSLLLNAHLDTVGTEEMDDPFNLKREGDRFYGRGAYDMKGSIAVMLLLAKYFSRYKPSMDILLTFVADEEDRSIGMEYLVEKWLPTISNFPVGGVFLEPTELEIGVGHKGFAWYEIEILGKGAHGSEPGKGIDAIFPLISALLELKRIQSDLVGHEAHPLLGHASLHVGMIEGGTALSTIPSRSRLQWERRTLPRESPHHLDLEMENVIDAVKNTPGNHKVKGRQIFIRSPYEISGKAAIVKNLQSVSPESKRVGVPFWADSALAGTAGIPSVLFGPVGHGAHAADEWVSLKSLVYLYNILKDFLLTFKMSTG